MNVLVKKGESSVVTVIVPEELLGKPSRARLFDLNRVASGDLWELCPILGRGRLNLTALTLVIRVSMDLRRCSCIEISAVFSSDIECLAEPFGVIWGVLHCIGSFWP